MVSFAAKAIIDLENPPTSSGNLLNVNINIKKSCSDESKIRFVYKLLIWSNMIDVESVMNLIFNDLVICRCPKMMTSVLYQLSFFHKYSYCFDVHIIAEHLMRSRNNNHSTANKGIK